MIYSIGQLSLSELEVSTAFTSITPPSAFHKWKVEIVNGETYHVNGIGSPITGGEFTIGDYGMGNGKLKYAYFDDLIVSQNRIRVYYKGNKKYEGFVNGEPDPSGGDISISPNKDKIQNALYNADYSSTFIGYKDLLENVITSLTAQTGILWNETFVDTGTTEVISPKYDYSNANIVINEIEDQLDNRYSGYDENNYYYLRKFSTTINHYIYYSSNPPYQSMKIKKDDKKIKITRAQVYQKSTILNENIRIGQVGYSSTSAFPTLEIEQFVGIKEGKITVPQGLNTTNALNYAYNQIIANTDRKINVTIKGFDLNYNENIQHGDMLRIWDTEKLQWRNIIDCESTTYWDGGVTLSTIAKFDTYSISNFTTTITQFTTYASTGLTQFMSYNFIDMKRWYKIKKIGFWIQSDVTGNHIEFSLSNYNSGYGKSHYSLGNYSIGESVKTIKQFDTSYTYRINIQNPNTWKFVSFNVNIDNFTSLYWRTSDTSAKIYIDNIGLLQYHNEYYDVNVKEIKYYMGSDLVDITAGQFDENINDDFFKLQNDVKKLQESFQQ